MSKTSLKTRKKLKLLIAKITRVSYLRKNVKGFFGVSLIFIGLLYLYLLPGLNIFKNPTSNIQDLKSKKEPISASRDFKKNENSTVVQILIPAHNIDLPVKQALLTNGYWQTSETGASHGQGSSNPGERGNVVIFAHAREGLFYNLRDAKLDDIVYLFTKDKWYRYKISEVKTVYPNDTTVVAPTKKEVLTLFTCSGFFDEKRLIVKAQPTN